jgi:ATP-dependent DNA helicase RecG
VTLEKIENFECVKVVFSGTDTPYSSSNVYFVRVADEDVKMSRVQLEEFLRERYNREHPWDQRTSNKTVSDVSTTALQQFVERGNAAGRISFTYDNPQDVLERLRLLDGDKLLNAGRLCFCDPPFSLIKMADFAGRDHSSTILDMKRNDGNLFDAWMAGWQYVLKNTRQRFEFNGGRREEIPEIPTAAVREAIINALCHREWDETMDVSVSIFSDRVEVFSPGSFPEGVDPKDLLSGKKKYSKSRNQLLADTLNKSKDMESFGTGLRRIQTLCDEAKVRVEVATEPWGFTVVFYRPDWSKEFGESSNRSTLPRTEKKEAIEAFLAQAGEASSSEISGATAISLTHTKRLLNEMIVAGTILVEGSARSTRYRLI